MNNNNVNRCIECNVVSCANHAKSENFCALDRINVNTDETEPKTEQCTCCNSFVPGSCTCSDCDCE